MNLILSIAALLLGPIIYAFGRRNSAMRQILDGFIFITIAGIICVDIIPEALTVGGTLAVIFLVLGLAFPVIIERTPYGRGDDEGFRYTEIAQILEIPEGTVASRLYHARHALRDALIELDVGHR